MPSSHHLKKVEVNGAVLHYVEAGTEHEQAVLFVHGGMGDYRTWNPQMGPFSERYHAVSYSRRAFYPNPWPNGYDAAMMQHVEDMAALVERLGLGRAHLVANSYGGYICLHFARRYPHLARTLSLAEPPVQPLLMRLPGGGKMLDEVRQRAWIPSRHAFRRGDLEEGVRLFLDGAVGHGTFESMPPRVREAMMKNAPEMSAATLADFDAFMPNLTCEQASRIEAPTLLMRGEGSPLMYYLINDELARCLPNARQATIPHAAHVLHSHNPLEHNRLVLEFLKDKQAA